VSEKLGYIYLVREREHLLSNSPIYKVGMTRQHPDNQLHRLRCYKKGSEILLVLQCPQDHALMLEGRILKRFRTSFEAHPDGREHFLGEPDVMRDIIEAEVRDARDQSRADSLDHLKWHSSSSCSPCSSSGSQNRACGPTDETLISEMDAGSECKLTPGRTPSRLPSLTIQGLISKLMQCT
jgi:T5orf172 domain